MRRHVKVKAGDLTDTSTDRKIRCDCRLPICSNCLRSGRSCQGRGLRLAWPKHNDKRRSLTSFIPTRTVRSRRITEACFLNVTFEDLELFDEFFEYQLSHGELYRAYRTDRRMRLANHCPSKAVSWNVLDERNRVPLNYFVSFGGRFFTATQGAVLAPLVLKIALSDSSDSSKAVLQSILALSCAHLGRDDEASAYRASAVSSLSSALELGHDVKVAFQAIASSMLLCTFETYHVSNTSSNWAVYLCGCKNIILGSTLTDVSIHDEEFLALRDWIYFYEVISRFTLVHWLNEPEIFSMCHENLSQRIGGPKQPLKVRTADAGCLERY